MISHWNEKFPRSSRVYAIELFGLGSDRMQQSHAISTTPSGLCKLLTHFLSIITTSPHNQNLLHHSTKHHTPERNRHHLLSHLFLFVYFSLHLKILTFFDSGKSILQPQRRIIDRILNQCKSSSSLLHRNSLPAFLRISTSPLPFIRSNHALKPFLTSKMQGSQEIISVYNLTMLLKQTETYRCIP